MDLGRLPAALGPLEADEEPAWLPRGFHAALNYTRGKSRGPDERVSRGKSRGPDERVQCGNPAALTNGFRAGIPRALTIEFSPRWCRCAGAGSAPSPCCR